MRISIRLNDEYDEPIIKQIKSYKNNHNLSKLLRKFIRDGFNNISKTQQNQSKIEKWNFPK